jgi:pilus assembly protein CpaB
MRAIFGLVLVAGVGLAGGAVYMAKEHIGKYQTALAKERAARMKMVKTVDVYVTDKAFKYGEEMVATDLRAIAWPETSVPEGAFTAQNPPFANGDAKPRYVIRAMEKNEPVLAVKVTEPGEEAGLTSRLERGFGAYSIKVDATSGVSGFLRPGDKVDVYWTGRPDRQLQQTFGEVTRLIQEGLKVIAVDQSTGSDEVNSAVIARTVTVAASKDQILVLTQGQATGRLSLSLVAVDDDTIAGTLEIDQRQLLGIKEEEKEEVAAVEEERECFITQQRGTERVKIQIACRD